jgi:hypothetical protein
MTAHAATLRQKQEKKRLAEMKRTPDDHESVNTAKRYKLPEAAIEIIAKAGAVHGQQSRAIQVAVELLWWAGPEEFQTTDEDILRIVRSSPLTGKTYKLPERTVTLIDEMAPVMGTRGNVMCAVAIVLKRIDKIEPLLPRGKPTTKQEKKEWKKKLLEVFGRTSLE